MSQKWLLLCSQLRTWHYFLHFEPRNRFSLIKNQRWSELKWNMYALNRPQNNLFFNCELERNGMFTFSMTLAGITTIVVRGQNIVWDPGTLVVLPHVNATGTFLKKYCLYNCPCKPWELKMCRKTYLKVLEVSILYLVLC